MKTRNWEWTSNDGLAMYAQSWEPDNAPKAVVLVVHGLGEHSGRYANVGKVLADAGYAFVGFDLRGNGKSAGKRGHYPSLETLMADIQEQYQQVEKRYPDVPRFLYGHSLGGVFVLVFATFNKPELAGIISTAPALRSPVLEQKFQMSMVNLLGGLLPNLTIPTGLNSKDISRDPEIVSAYINDPLVHNKATLSTGKVGLKAIDWVLSHTDDFSTPLLIMHGTEDKLVYLRGSEELTKLIKQNLTFKQFIGLHHEIHNEPEQDEVLAFMVDWMNSQLNKK